MTKTIMLIPAGPGTGLPSVLYGIVDRFLSLGIMTKGILTDPSATIDEEELLDRCIRDVQDAGQTSDVVVVGGLLIDDAIPYAHLLNHKIASALDAFILFVSKPENNIDSLIREYKRNTTGKLLGTVVNKVGAPKRTELVSTLYFPPKEREEIVSSSTLHSSIKKLPILGQIPWRQDLIAFRLSDLLHYTPLQIIHRGELNKRRIQYITLAGRHVHNMITVIQPGHLLIMPGDRIDILLACCLAELRNKKLAGIILTGGFAIPDPVYQLCETAFSAGLPVLSTESDSYTTCVKLDNINLHTIPEDDEERRNISRQHIAEHINVDWIKKFVTSSFTRHLTPPAFRYQLVEKARQAQKTILLPEGEDPRILKAANIATKKGIARIILLGQKETLRQLANSLNIELDSTISIVDPETIRHIYVDELIALRQHRGITREMAEEYLRNDIILANMMLHKGEVHGVVAGTRTPTADVLRPALQIIKTKKEISLVSSIFFMCLPQQILVYGDCAVNTNPNAQQLADIAIQSADSAKLFGIEPIVAMISYSTLRSGVGADVEKVREAMSIVRDKRPDILIDGPLQYDAAYTQAIAEQKASRSKVAGRATVFIFPDLNTGNTTYKAVQQSADIYAFGPMLQGLNKPVNDLSRGALVDDIVYTIAITAIQALS